MQTEIWLRTALIKMINILKGTQTWYKIIHIPREVRPPSPIYIHLHRLKSLIWGNPKSGSSLWTVCRKSLKIANTDFINVNPNNSMWTINRSLMTPWIIVVWKLKNKFLIQLLKMIKNMRTRLGPTAKVQFIKSLSPIMVRFSSSSNKSYPRAICNCNWNKMPILLQIKIYILIPRANPEWVCHLIIMPKQRSQVNLHVDQGPQL